jgi:PAS domain S-box-containing protein
MYKVHFKKRILSGFLLTLISLTWLAILSDNSKNEVITSSKWVAHTHDVLFHAEKVLAVATNIEIGQRGFSLSGNEEFLEPYREAQNEIHSHLDRLRELTKDNSDQQQLVKELRSDIGHLLMFSSSAINARKQSFESAQQMNASLQGKGILDKIRQQITTFENHEKDLLQKRIYQNEAEIKQFNTSFVILLVATGLILLFVFYAINVNLKARNESEQRLKKASDEIKDLYDNAPCGYHSLNANGDFVDINKTLLQWLGYSNRNDVVGKMNFRDVISSDDTQTFMATYPVFKETGFVHNLEFNLKRKDGSDFPVVLSSTALVDANGRFIKSRSNTFDNTVRKQKELEIKELNHDLEAFSYSVSHDLRAPLRSIDGYACVLQEDYFEKLDAEGKRVITVIMNNAKRMGQLIDDLLNFARLGRKDVAPTQPDMTAVVTNIANELVQLEKERKIDFIIHPLKSTEVDIDMIRQVWTNLISNAIKYTGKSQEPRIEISSHYQGDEICYQVKDNGVGFDMQYSGKLFGVFQRLHKMQDFNGTGVGLAIVKRIIGRHKGRVWAEGQINSGASFYFTIPHVNGKQ